MAEESKTKVLLIEDNPADVRLMQEAMAEMEGKPFELESVNHLQEGFKRLAEGRIDLILLDLNLPDSSGADTFSNLYPKAQDVPIVVMTGLKDEELGFKLMQMGAQDYLVKGQTDAATIGRTLHYAIERNNIVLQLRRYAEKGRTVKAEFKKDKLSPQKILFIHHDEKQRELLAGWLRAEGCDVMTTGNMDENFALLPEHKYEILIIDLDVPEAKEKLPGLCRKIKDNPYFSSILPVALTRKEDGQGIASALEAGVDFLMLWPFEANQFQKQVENVFKQKIQGKKTVGLDIINTLINAVSEGSRQNFFLLSAPIFNQLIICRIKGMIGEPILTTLTARAEKLIGDYYGFMKAVKFQKGVIIMDGVDNASKEVSVVRLAAGFKDYVYVFLWLVQTLTSDILIEWG